MPVCPIRWRVAGFICLAFRSFMALSSGGISSSGAHITMDLSSRLKPLHNATLASQLLASLRVLHKFCSKPISTCFNHSMKSACDTGACMPTSYVSAHQFG